MIIQKGEKTLFEGMLKINGIGPKAALAICSTFTPEQFAGIISSKDVNALKKVPGIGPKTVEQIRNHSVFKRAEKEISFIEKYKIN